LIRFHGEKVYWFSDEEEEEIITVSE